MVSYQSVQQSNARIASLPKGLVALFIGATKGIGQSALEHFAQHAPSPHIYTVARPTAVVAHENRLASLRQSNPSNVFDLITADISLVSEVDKIVNAIKQKETKLDILFVSPGFMAFEGRKLTREGLEPSMTTRYYSRLRVIHQLLLLLKNAPSPRIVSVLAGGLEAKINEDDLDLRGPGNWSFWNASVHSTTMGTLAFELLAQENPELSIVHWYPGPVATPGLAGARKFGMSPPNPMSQEEGGARAIFFATNDRYAVRNGFVSVPDGLDIPQKSGGGIFLIGPDGENNDNEGVLADMRQRGIDKRVWEFTQKVFKDCKDSMSNLKDEL